ncbi:MAG: hypothetical protein K1X65_15015 [Caldilineales bacterium]|nr:hypothetical protein [Caldilineales bacterium]
MRNPGQQSRMTRMDEWHYFEPYRHKALAALAQSGMEREDVGGVSMWVFPQPPAFDWELTWDGFHARV